MNSVADMRAAVLFDGPEGGRKLSRFWLLLALSAVIAAAGVVADSTATVIGAMIVAPLMTPILGIVLATVLGDRRNLVTSWALVVAGAATAVAVGYLIGMLVPVPVVAGSNGQVAARVAPSLIDLLAALATGAVGAFALVRRDISDTLPGVAVAISLVPPLSVVGLTLESGAFDQSLGALLLFVTNVTAILMTGVVVLLVYRVNPAVPFQDPKAAGRRRQILTIVVALVVIAIPLTATSVRVAHQSLRENTVHGIVQPWATPLGWEVAAVMVDGATITVRLTGSLPLPATDPLIADLTAAGISPDDVHLEFIPAYTVDLGGDTGP